MEHSELYNHPDFQALVTLLRGKRFVALTGAGCSTESGIPDYRSPQSLQKPRKPIQYADFIGRPEARLRYWARSTIGWPKIREARPNPAHKALASLEQRGLLQGVITQNVDRLHQAAGSQRVLELHGALAEVRCLSCGALSPREELQARLLDLNPAWLERCRKAIEAPDGDAELSPEETLGFRVPGCRSCCGLLKPNVVFFGENVPPQTVEAAWSLLEEAEALLVLGSSLAVFSGYRFVRGAVQKGLPVAICNLGPTRGDDHAKVKLEARLGRALPALAEAL